MTPRRTLWAALLVLAAGCGLNDASGLDATLVQYREDEVIGIVQAHVHNGSDEAVRITEVALRWTGLEPLEPAPVDHLLAPGQTLDVPVDFGDARCTDPPRADDRPPPGPIMVVGTLEHEDGPPEPFTLPLVDTRGIGPKVFRIGCERQAVEWAASIGFAEEWAETTLDGYPAVLTEVVIEPNHADGPVRIRDLDGSVLLAVREQAGEEVAVVSTGFCTGHAFAESKKTFIFHAVVDLGEGEPISYEIRPDPPLQAAMQDVIDERCGLT